MTGRAAIMIPGAFAGAWCWSEWRRRLEDRGRQVSTPELLHHEKQHDGQAPAALAGTGLQNYVDALAEEISAFDQKPIIFGHSLGGLLAQMLAARDLAAALVLLAPASPWGILPTSASEIAAAKGLMSLGPFWIEALHADFATACGNSLTHIPKERQQTVFDQFVPESGQALFESMFWMLDANRAAFIEPGDVNCPILFIAGAEDSVIAPQTIRQTASRYGTKATLNVVDNHGHMLLIEPGWQRLADSAFSWLERIG